ncbi:Alpha/Beta hydrolase protein [Auriculariales sp. MPI-PUGE-AT-0066]|nr:Alpha/Beta hydrolase protein [Auriculariales sp. MPI-PUGE-AT-0066]
MVPRVSAALSTLRQQLRAMSFASSKTRVVSLLAAVGLAEAAAKLQSRQGAPPNFDWSTQVTPSIDLKALVPCYGSFKCGLLSVPLDYSRANGPNATIAVAVLPATDTANYKGSVLFNPGGPGGPGTQAILQLGPLLAPIIGPAYDIVGFDPRGTGFSLPSGFCFDTQDWATFEQTEIYSLESRVDVGYALARSEIVAAKCAETHLGTGSGSTVEEVGGGRFMDTSTAASDMLSIVRALGEDKLNYYGISYGTVIGQHFAAMYPDHVGLMLIDGITDAVNWRAANLTPELQDSDRVFNAFIDLCTKGGPTVCPIAEKTSKQTAARLERLLASLKAQPIAVYPHANGYHIVTYDELRAFIRTQIYAPLNGFPILAGVFAAVEARNVSALHDFGAANPGTGLAPWNPADQSLQLITCTDFPDLGSTTLDAAWKMVHDAIEVSRWFGSIMTRVPLQCIPWKIRPGNPYTGSFDVAEISGKILVASNTLDPITPLADAQTVVKRFPTASSALLEQNTIGHTITFQMGNCAAAAIGAFFQSGVLPTSGTLCQPDQLPFIGNVTEGIQSA